VSSLESKPLKGLRVGLIRETIDKGVDAGVISAIRAAAMHFEELGCSVNEVRIIFLYEWQLLLVLLKFVLLQFIFQDVLFFCYELVTGLTAILFPWVACILYPCCV